MKRKFKITIEGVSHEVEVEEISSEAGSQSAGSTSVSPPAKPKANKAAEFPTTSPAAAGKGVLVAPMPGLILSIKVKVGDTVKTGDILLILEAMKMDTEVPALKDGVVKEIFVSAGQNVKRGVPLLTIEG